MWINLGTGLGYSVLEVVKAWIDFPAPKRLETIHHLGGERFMVAGPTIRLRTRAK